METAFLIRVGVETLVYPALVSAVSFWALTRLVGAGRAGAAALAAGYLTGHWLAVGFPPLPPVETTQWLFPLATAAGIVALATERPVLFRNLSALLVVGGVILALNPMWRHHWGLARSLLGLALAVGAGLALWLAAAGLEKRIGGPAVTLVLAVTAGVAGGLLGLSATTLLAQLAWTTAACLGVLFAIGLWSRLPARPLIPVALILLTGLTLNGYFYARLSGWSLGAVLVALPAAWLACLSPLRSKPKWQQAAVAVLAVLLATGPAVAVAVRDYLATPDYCDDY